MSAYFDLFEKPKTSGGVSAPAVALTIAGSDSGGGAGIQADLKTFAACGVFGTSALTLLTAQNTQGVTLVEMASEAMVRAQLDAVLGDLKPSAAKTGALGTEAMISFLVEYLEDHPIESLVVDPVMISKHGEPLMPESAFASLREKLLPRALIVTPNRFEAAHLTGMGEVESLAEMKEAAKRLFGAGARHVVIKGGHFDRIVRDVFYDGSGFVEFGADRVDSKRVHGSGCTFSAAICARLARQDALVDAVAFAREFISEAIEKAPRLGEGISPVNPMHGVWR
ncbi:bifunctional hydroxymethylpyrimidine kinase/phosphomethylpyrimidine kinase [Lujinxingia litoralis]|uniref:hydroxymethylpyrimidine kinase n=1 Tax=Lujinxingia litoralis TaxID=2211119 RepID=A0A328C2Z0_9DELT|nr:bifunctional hydroxymethylpyrimidine kinase/phosphomethylpyrimidine kinase [Lujinxingia litoralis]RAL21163.1 bifunctional hydroxymethylpyrimidine kinase/phosphomethylpyrimidine kinase [Lujinxingia litoralis]